MILFGLLNFIDGLWLSCGDEWIIIFIINYKDKLDFVLFWLGCMDMYIYMLYCIFCGFKVLINNYFGIKYYLFCGDIERFIEEV